MEIKHKFKKAMALIIAFLLMAGSVSTSTVYAVEEGSAAFGVYDTDILDGDVSTACEYVEIKSDDIEAEYGEETDTEPAYDNQMCDDEASILVPEEDALDGNDKQPLNEIFIQPVETLIDAFVATPQALAESVAAVNLAGDGASRTIVLTDSFAMTGQITVNANRGITLISDGSSRTLTSVNTNNQRHFVVNGALTLQDNVTLAGSGAVNSGGVAVHSGGSLYLYGGTVSGGRALRGGNVSVYAGGVFYMYGGTISGGIATQGGGNVLVQNGSFYMHGGTISDGAISSATAANQNGGGILVTGADARFTMSHGEIRNNTTTAISGFNGGAGVRVEAGAVFNMSNGSISDNVSGRHAGGVIVTGPGSRFNMSGGAISGNDANGALVTPSLLSSGMGGGVLVDNEAVFKMSGGAIYDNTARMLGGGVNIERNAQFVMKGDSVIRDNNVLYGSAAQGGGGIFIQNTGSSFHMYGGTIYGNEANHTGGVRLHDDTTFVMRGGVIRNNTARTGNGGGVNLRNGATFDMHGGRIDMNTAEANGGGVSVQVAVTGGSSSVFNMYNGIIYDNTANGTAGAQGGGGVFVIDNDSEFNMYNGMISNNTAQLGGGVRVTQGLFTMTDGKIKGNTAVQNGGGIWLGTRANPTAVTGARFNMIGGEIINNTATNGDGGGIFASPTGTVNPLPAAAYPSITAIATGAVFSNNMAGGGLFASPEALSTAHGYPFRHLLTNYNINFRGPNRLVIFNLNGGNVSGNVENVILARPPLSVVGVSHVPEPERLHYMFSGWRYTNQVAGTQNLTNAQVEARIISESITFTAQWTRITHPVTFELDGGSVGIVTGNIVNTLSQGSAIGVVNVPAVTRLHYSFEGWRYIGQEAGTLNMTSAEVAGHILLGPITLIAQWAEIIHNVTFDTRGGSVIAAQVIMDGQVAIRPIDPTRSGFAFEGWFETEALAVGTGGSTFDFDMPIDNSLTLFARWAPVGDNGNESSNSGSGSRDGSGSNSGSYFNGEAVVLSDMPVLHTSIECASYVEIIVDGTVVLTGLDEDGITFSLSVEAIIPYLVYTEVHIIEIYGRNPIGLNLPISVLGGNGLEVVTDFGSVIFPNDTLQNIRRLTGDTLRLFVVISEGGFNLTLLDVNNSELVYNDLIYPLFIRKPVVVVPGTIANAYVPVKRNLYGNVILPYSIYHSGEIIFKTHSTGEFGIIYNHRTFADVNQHWASSFITFAAARGLFLGVGDDIFSADTPMSRAMFAQVIANLYGTDMSAHTEPRFSDVSPGVWYASAVEWAASAGVLHGYDDGRFGPDDHITREQMAVMLANYISYRRHVIPVKSEQIVFDDGIGISQWAYETVMTMQSAGIITGRTDGRFDPQGSATRAEVAAIFARYIEAYIGHAVDLDL